MTQRDGIGQARTGKRTAVAAVALAASVLATSCGDDSDSNTLSGGSPSPEEVMAEGRPTDDVVEELDSRDLTDPWIAVSQIWDDCDTSNREGATLYQYQYTVDGGPEVVGWGFSGDVWHAGTVAGAGALAECYESIRDLADTSSDTETDP